MATATNAAAAADNETKPHQQHCNSGDHETAVVEDEELFELNLELLNRAAALPPPVVMVMMPAGGGHREDAAAAAAPAGHALLANCLLPVTSVSRAMPFTTNSICMAPVETAAASRRFGGGKVRAGRSSRSVRFSFSSRGFGFTGM